MTVECLKQQGTSHCSSDLLKICVNIGASWSAVQTFIQAGETPSAPGLLFFENSAHVLHADLIRRLNSRRGRRRVAGGVGVCVKCRSERVWGMRLGFSNRQ